MLLKLCLKKNPGEKQNGQLGELVLRSCDAFGECLKPQDPLIMIWLPIFLRVAIPWGRWPLMPCKVAQDGNTVDTGYKVTAYKTKSDIKLSFHSPKVPF